MHSVDHIDNGTRHPTNRWLSWRWPTPPDKMYGTRFSGLLPSLFLRVVAVGVVAEITTSRSSLSYLGVAIMAAVAASIIYESRLQLIGEV